MEVFNEQYMLKGLKFDGCHTGIKFKRSFVTVIQGCTFSECAVAVDASLPDSTGTLSVVDSSFFNCEYGVDVYTNGTIPSGVSPLVLHNVAVEGDNVKAAVIGSGGSTLLSDLKSRDVTWIQGKR